MHTYPTIIQGGMGAGVSGWPLARAVSQAGQLGVVAGTALDVILVRRLQLGDAGGHMRRALESLPLPGVAQWILDRWYVPGGKPPDAAFRPAPSLEWPLTRELEQLLVAANFVEVFLAREGHGSPVGVNYLEKIQLPTLPSLFGAMLAGVDYVLMGAGIPRAIPGVLDRLSAGKSVELRLDVHGATDDFVMCFDPQEFCGGRAPKLERPRFLAIVASTSMATMMCRKASGRVDGLVVEGPTAGGHNAPPRGRLRLDEAGEPIYGERDEPDLTTIAKLGVPFWLAGSYGTPERLREALERGATGVQVGTPFAYCEESGLSEEIKRRVLELSRAGDASVFTDPSASPTGFPFKVLNFPGTLSDQDVWKTRTRVCDLGYLRHAYQQPDGKLGWRCPGEPIPSFLRKGGGEQEALERKCVCNGLLANIGLGQVRRSEPELPLITSGDDVATVARFLGPEAVSYRAVDVILQLASGVSAAG
jgi:nitronate monooxygenase